MRREVFDCDKCGKQSLSDYGTIWVAIGERSNGVDYDEITEKIDMCPKCLAGELSMFFKNMDYDKAAKWLKDFQSRSTFVRERMK